MSVEATLVKSAPKRTPVKAVPECLRNRASTAGQRNDIAANSDVAWPAVGSAARTHRSRTPAWCRCKTAMAVACAETRYDSVSGGLLEYFIVAITDRQHNLLSPEDDAGCILSFAENVCDERSSQCLRQSEA